MAEERHVGDLAIHMDEDFQRNEWRVERLGWVIMALILLMGLLGLLGGPGPLSDISLSAGGLQINYSRFAHMMEPTSLELLVHPNEAADTVQVWISNSYLDHTKIEGIVPEPESVEAGNGRAIFQFELGEDVQEARIVFYLNPERPGSKQGTIAVEGGASLEVTQFVYP